MNKEDNISNNLKSYVDNNVDNKLEKLPNNNLKGNFHEAKEGGDESLISDIYGNVKINRNYNTDISLDSNTNIQVNRQVDRVFVNGVNYSYEDLLKRENIEILKEYLLINFPNTELEQVNKNTMLSSFAKFFGKKDSEQVQNNNVSSEAIKNQKIFRDLITTAYHHADNENDFLALDVMLNHKGIPKLHDKNYKDFLVHWAVLEGNEKMVKQLFRLPIILNNFQRSSKIMAEDSTIIDTAKKVNEPNNAIIEFLYTLPCHINEYKEKCWHEKRLIPNQDKIDAIHKSHFTRLMDTESGPAKPLTFNDTLLKQITENRNINSEQTKKTIEP